MTPAGGTNGGCAGPDARQQHPAEPPRQNRRHGWEADDPVLSSTTAGAAVIEPLPSSSDLGYRREIHRNARGRLGAGPIALVEVDCDLGAGIPGAGSGIAQLRRAVHHQEDLRRIRARHGEITTACTTPHARHIHTLAGVIEAAAALVAGALDQGRFPIVLAGDHSTAAGTIAGIRRSAPHGRLGVVWIDAHADLHSPFTTPSGNMHGMPLAIAAGHDNRAHGINDPDLATRASWDRCKALAGGEDPALRLQDLIYVGVRDIEAAEASTIEAHGIPIVSTEEVRRAGPRQAARRCLEHLEAVDLIYVSFDVDSLDASICQGTGTPSAGGLWAEEVMEIHRTLIADPRVCCWEICEINPHLDTLDSINDLSAGVFQVVLEGLEARLDGGSVFPLGCPGATAPWP